MTLFLLQEALEYAKYFKIEGASMETTLILLGALVVSVLAGTGVWAIVHYGGLWMARQYHRDMFRKAADTHRLTPAERQFLRRVAQIYNLAQIELLVTSPRSFDRYIFRMIERLDKLPADKQEPRLRMIASIREKLGFDRLEEGELLQSTRELEVGLPLDVAIPYEDGEVKVPGHVQTNEEKHWIVELEDIRSVKGKVPVSAPLKVSLTMPDDASYEIPAVVTEVDMLPVTRLCLQHTQSIRRVQHRRYPRMDTRLPVTFAVLSESQEKQLARPREILKFEEGTLQYGHIMNLGGGGLAMMTDVPIETKQLVHLTFSLGEVSGEISGIIGRVLHVEESEPGRYLLYTQFVKIPEMIRRQILRFIFNALRKEPELSERTSIRPPDSGQPFTAAGAPPAA